MLVLLLATCHPSVVKAQSIISCNGFIPNPCARTDMGLTTDANGNGTNGSTSLLANLISGQVAVDPYFGERLVRITDVNSKSGTQYSTPEAGWKQIFNCAGQPQCNSSTYHMFAVEESGGNGRVYAVNPGTMALTRVDASTLNGNDTAFNLQENWSSLDSNRMYAAVYNNETTAHGMNYEYYEWTPATPGPVTPVTQLVFNAGPHGSSFDTGMPGSAAMLDGLMTLVSFAAVAAPTVSTSACGSTPNCIQVATTGGTLSGTVYFAFTEDAADGAGLLHEQDLAGCSGCFASYTFTGGTGEIVAVNAPTESTTPAGVSWHLYAENVGNVNLALQQFQVAYASATGCSGAGGGACPALPVTSLASFSASNHMNLSCEQTQSRSADCYLGMVVISKDDTRFVFMTGGLGQDLYPVTGLWDTTKGLRWLDMSTGLVHNGSTDAAGVKCIANGGTASDCWTAPTGAITRVTDPNDSSLSTSYATGLHEVWESLDGHYVFLQANQVKSASESTWLWDPNTATVYVSSTLGTASNVGGHQAEGYQFWTGASSGNPPLDGEFDFRSRVISTGSAPASCANQQFSGVNCYFNYYNWSNGGACAIGSACAMPAPNMVSTGSGYTNFGISRRNVHFSAVNEVAGDPYPYLAITYMQGPPSIMQYSIATNGCTRSNNVATIQTTGTGFISFLPGDLVTVNCTTGDGSFNGNFLISAMTWGVNGTTQFGYVNTGANVSTGMGGGTVTKTDLRPARALENEVFLQSHDGSGKTWRFAHECYDGFGSTTLTGPNGSISQDGHYALMTCYDGTRTDPVLVELR